jgi:hypothetical protein
MAKFGFLYHTEDENDDGYRVIEAANMEAAKAINKAQIIAEGTHGATYHLSAIHQIKEG